MSQAPNCILFEMFELNVAERSLKKADILIPLGAPEFDILMALIDRAGEIVTRSDLTAKLRPASTVKEGRLDHHLSVLRIVLRDSGQKYIEDVKGGGYRFVAPVRAADEVTE